MNKASLLLCIPLLMLYACEQEFSTCQPDISFQLPRYVNEVKIDSSYTYPGDSLYQTWLYQYNQQLAMAKTRGLCAEDEEYFNRKYEVESTESVILYGRNYIYPGAIMEGNSISDQNYAPIFVENRNPITVSMTLAHNTPIPTSRTIENPSYSKLNDYVVEMVKDGNFSQNLGFTFTYKRFSFYDEIKSAFGTNIDTRKLFSSKSESSTEERNHIQKKTGMYVTFSQKSFRVDMDIAPLSDQPIEGNSGYEPVYVNSVTYGRYGILVFETNESYDFAEKCIKKEFERIFYHKTTILTESEQRFLDTTDFKVLIIGADSNLVVQTVKGYSRFLDVIYLSEFTEQAYGVPILCTFSYANSHEIVKTKFTNTVHIQPLFVEAKEINREYSPDYGTPSDFTCSGTYMLYFYEDRAKTMPAYPSVDIEFPIVRTQTTMITEPDYDHWPMQTLTSKSNTINITMRNTERKPQLYVGENHSHRITHGTLPVPNGPVTIYKIEEYYDTYTLEASPFYRKI